MVPVNLDPPGRELPRELGNHFALVLAVLPHGPAPFADRLREVHHRMARIRGSWEAELTFALSRGLAVSPALLGGVVVRVLGAKAVGVLTNVPGPREPMALAGARVAGAVGFAPTSDRQAITACTFSYTGRSDSYVVAAPGFPASVRYGHAPHRVGETAPSRLAGAAGAATPCCVPG